MPKGKGYGMMKKQGGPSSSVGTGPNNTRAKGGKNATRAKQSSKGGGKKGGMNYGVTLVGSKAGTGTKYGTGIYNGTQPGKNSKANNKNVPMNASRAKNPAGSNPAP